MSKAKQGKVVTRLIDTGIYRTFEKHLVLDDGTDIPLSKFARQVAKLIRKGEMLAHIAAEVQDALDDDSEFKGEAQEAAKMLDKLKAALSDSDAENVMYWSYFIGRAMERHYVRRHERNAKIGKQDQGRRRKGGKTRRALKTTKETRRCYELIDEHSRNGVSRSAVCIRVACDLSKELGRTIGERAVRGCWERRSEQSDNA